MIGDRSFPTPIAALGESALIERIKTRAGRGRDWITLGIGDDAAVIRSERNAQIVITTDSQVEGVHFRRDWTSMSAIGRKAVAVNLSDLAAMGATPRACLLSLALPDHVTVDDFDALVDGAVSAADEATAPIVGGNLARSPGPLFVDVTALGAVHGRRLMMRSGGKPGDLLYVTGEIGGAAAALGMLGASADRAHLDALDRDCLARLESPTARVSLGRRAATSRAVRACVDVSDGLAAAVRELARASGTGALVEAARLPIQPGARRWAERAHQDPVASALAGGEDYELLFAIAPKRRRAFLAAVGRRPDVPVTLVGELIKETGVWLVCDGIRTPLPDGFRHF